jgi:CRISPR type IV-associated protein Csf3
MKPLRLEWRLITPIVTGGQPLHLDALLAYAVTQEALGATVKEGASSNQRESIRTLAVHLPLEKSVQGDEWVWMASAIRPCVGAARSHGMRYWTRKSDADDIAHRYEQGQIMMGKRVVPGLPPPLKPFALPVDQSRGLFKQMFKYYPIKVLTTVEAFCIGDRDRIEELLTPENGFVLSLGARGRIGHGLIGSFAITEDSAATERWQERVLPWQVPGTVPMQLAVRPPYWDVANQRNAFVRPDLFL